MICRLLLFATFVFTIAAGRPASGQDGVPRAQAVNPSGFGAPTPAPYSSYSAMDRAGMTSRPINPNQRLNVGDVVSFEIVEDREKPAALMVTPTGDIDVYPLGRVRVAGKTTGEAEADIKRELEKDYYYTATVNLSIDRVNPSAALSKVQVSGEVAAQGNVEWPSGEPFHLSEAIQRAGGFGKWAKPEQVVLYRQTGGGTSKSTHNVKRILKEGLVSEDPLLRDGDRIVVEKTWFKFKD